jgi:hypothetical protein
VCWTSYERNFVEEMSFGVKVEKNEDKRKIRIGEK